jgi:hypothetical protein
MITLSREYFLDAGGRLAKEDRIKLLVAAGHRRCSVDLSSYRCRQVLFVLKFELTSL